MTAWQKIVDHYMSNRLLEWVMTCSLIFMGTEALIWPMAIERGLFRYMLAVFSVNTLIAFYLIFGSLRAVALTANGRWPKWGPIFRMCGAGGGALLMGQMTVSLIMAGPESNGAPSLSIPIFFFLMLGELYSAHRASRAYA